MKQNSNESEDNKLNKSSVSKSTNNPSKAREIRLMTARIISRYEIFDVNLALALASELYKNGIRLEKFQPKYYEAPFALDEIVSYVMTKLLAAKKIIKFPNQFEVPEEKSFKINEEYFLVEEELDNLRTVSTVQDTHSHLESETIQLNQEELHQITICLINRYEIIDKDFAYTVALELYKNGIGLDKFHPKYYIPPFHLDEIVSYVISKVLKDKKVIQVREISQDKLETEPNTKISISSNKYLVLTNKEKFQ